MESRNAVRICKTRSEYSCNRFVTVEKEVFKIEERYPMPGRTGIGDQGEGLDGNSRSHRGREKLCLRLEVIIDECPINLCSSGNSTRGCRDSRFSLRFAEYFIHGDSLKGGLGFSRWVVIHIPPETFRAERADQALPIGEIVDRAVSSKAGRCGA